MAANPIFAIDAVGDVQTSWDNIDSFELPNIDGSEIDLELNALRQIGYLDYQNAFQEQEERATIPEASDIDPNDINRLTLISSIRSYSTRHSIYAETFIPVPILPDYPITSENGTCYIVNWKDKDIGGKHVLDPMQFCRAKFGATRQTSSAYLDGASVQRLEYKCTGAKVCEYLYPELLNMSYLEVTEELWNYQERFRTQAKETIDSYPDITGITFMRVHMSFMQHGTLCKPHTPECKLQIVKATETVSGVDRYYLQCVQRDRSQKHISIPHWSRQINRELNSSIPIMKQVLQGTANISYGGCGDVQQNSKRGRTCSFDHPQGKGNMVNRKCDCRYQVFIPEDLDIMPYILVVCTGRHTHPIPPPDKLPETLRQEIWELITKTGTSKLTLPVFLTHPLVKEWLNNKDASHITAVHPTFANSSVLSNMFRKHRLLHWPTGSSLMAVQRLYEKQAGKPGQYIQYVFQNAYNFMVVCFNQEQFNLFKQLRSTTIDMNYKHLIEKDNREIIWAVYDESIRRNVALVRVITNSDSIYMYYFMFYMVFNIMESRYDYTVKWKHLTGQQDGFIGFTIDQDYKLLFGLGLYLSNLDEDRSHSWLWHIQRTIRFCKVHFQRGIEKQIGHAAPHGAGSDFELMMELLHMTSEHEYLELCNYLITDYMGGRYANWAKHKARDSIRCGLNVNCSMIAPEDWNQMADSTNPAEVQHQRSYNYGGRYQHLADCIEWNRGLDDNDFQAATIFKRYNISYSFRPDALSDRLGRWTQRTNRRNAKRQRDEALDIPDTDFEMPMTAIEEARRLSRYSSAGSTRSASQYSTTSRRGRAR
ncbi:hypothetical protein F4815DRAFT_468655 [Daldinia loculata]|nr:hypothetical protein F4815DRAFT_468655 [Daldinia loculata]